MTCAQRFEATGDPQAALAAATASRRLGRPDEVAAWADRLVDSPVDMEAAQLAGNTFFAAGRLADAKVAIEREYALRLAVDEPGETAKTAYKLAYIGWKQSDYRAAFEHAEVAYREATRAGDRPRAARTLGILYAVLFEIGDLAAAERALDQTLELDPGAEARNQLDIQRGLLQLRNGRPRIAQAAFESVLAPDREAAPPIRRAAHENLVETTLELGEVEAARRHVEAARELVAAVPGEESLLLALEAKVEAAEGRPEAAVDTLERAIAASPSPDRLQEMLFDRGRALEANGKDEAAEREYLRSISAIEESRRALGVDDYKEWLLAKRRRPYERLLALQARGGRTQEALATAEKIKARTFMDAFAFATSDLAGGRGEGSGSLLARRGGERIEALDSLLPALRESPVTSPLPVAGLLDALRGRWVLFFLETEESLWRIEIRDGEATIDELSTPVRAVIDGVERLAASPGDRATAEELGAALLAGTAASAGGAPLDVIADGALGRLPFALLRWKGRYLVEDHEISYAPSLTALAAIEDRVWSGGGEALVLADPIGDLPAAAREAADVAALVGGRALVGDAATSAELAAAAAPRLLHFATHTATDGRGPYLTMADRKVRAADVLTEPTDPAIVVLATCASASRRGSGIWGSMGAAFLASGARAVVASLWSLDDRAARDFILAFYREGGFQDPASGLANAQRSFIHSGKGPETWAPFVLLGSTTAIGPANEQGGDS